MEGEDAVEDMDATGGGEGIGGRFNDKRRVDAYALLCSLLKDGGGVVHYHYCVRPFMPELTS